MIIWERIFIKKNVHLQEKIVVLIIKEKYYEKYLIKFIKKKYENKEKQHLLNFAYWIS